MWWLRASRVCSIALVLVGCDRVVGIGDPYQDAGVKPIRFVQVVCAEYINTADPWSVALPSAMPGDTLVATVMHAGPGSSIALADDQGHAFVELVAMTFQRVGHTAALSNIAGGSMVVTATPVGGATPPLRMCVSEYAGAGTTTLATANIHRQGAEVPGLEEVAFDIPVSADRIAVSVMDAKGTDVQPASGFEVHPTTRVDILVEDADAIAAGQLVATIDSTGQAAFDPWFAVAIALSARF